MIENFLRFFYTVKYLRLEQIWYRLIYRHKRPVITEAKGLLEKKDWKWHGILIANQSIFIDGKVSFLSVIGDINSSSSWNDDSKEKLWLYNLHYFDDLNSINFTERESYHFALIKRWIHENRPCIGNGWEPYPTSLRLVNWVKWFSKKDTFDMEFLISIDKQAQALSQNLEYHILGNHLFSNGKALIFVGSFLQGNRAETYIELGLKIITRELDEQFLKDGAHFELSPMYHEILLLDLLELINLANISQNNKLLRCLPKWIKVAKKAIYWLKTMIHPDGEISFFNDSAFGIAAKPKDLFNFAKSLGIKSSYTCLPNFVTNRASGYSRFSSNIYTLIVDHGNIGPDYLPGHAHADTLSFELSVGFNRVFVNSGTSLYGVSEERLRQRKTAAHNTVVVEGEDSSEVWSGFRVARRAYSSLIKVSEIDGGAFIKAEHNGYKRLKANITHSREFSTGAKEIKIIDELSGEIVRASAFYHIHPDVVIEISSPYEVKLVTLENNHVVIRSSSVIQILDGTYHPTFGSSIENKILKMELSNNKLNVVINITEV